jgi:hypothetical protein
VFDRERAGLDQLGPVVQREERFERFALTLADGDEVDELPVILRRKTDTLLVRDAPERGRVNGTAEMDVELGELVPERMRQRLASLFARRRSADPPSAPRRGGTSLRMLCPDCVSIVVRGCDGDDPIPDLRATQLLLRGRARDVALQHHVAVVRRADLAPTVLREQVEQTSDLRESLGLLSDVLA